MLSVRVPISRAFDMTVERAFSAVTGSTQTTSAIMASAYTGGLRFFHRYQTGAYQLTYGGFSDTIQRQQIRSMSSYTAGSRLNLTLQLATQLADTGKAEHWEELQTTLKLTPTTTLRTVTAVPDIRNRERFQAYVGQRLPFRFVLQADYGRISAYQSIIRELDRSRLKLMLFKTVDFATPARGVTVAGKVIDHAGRPVAGARVKLGGYSADTDPEGVYRIQHVPRGEYDLTLESSLLPADYAWDGRRERLTVNSSGRIEADLKVAPLNSIHGRVYVDRNSNGRFDSGEAVANAVLRLGEHLTATDATGGYSFYNLWPGAYTVVLQRVPAEFTAGAHELTVTLLDGGPVTGADFRVLVKERPIIWSTGK
jgi:protocatechuate 3,4-dioxygenase beta subunit